MHPFDDMCNDVHFDDDDKARLRALWPLVASDARAIAAPLFVRLDDAGLHKWLQSLCEGPHDHAYAEHRSQIGRLHADLPARAMLMGAAHVRAELSSRAPNPESVRAIVRIIDVELGIILETRAADAHHAKLAMMAASVAHEIRNPLAGISGTVQVVQGTLPPDDKRSIALQKVQEHIVRLGGLVGDLLSFSRPITVHPRPLDVLVIAQAAATSEPLVKVAGHGTAQGDAALLTQVLLHLVQNAVQAGAKEILVLIEGTRVRVVDDGPGVTDEVRERVFEPFYTTKTRGTGLGLPIARKIVEAMGGTLTVCTSPLGGAGFEMNLRARE